MTSTPHITIVDSPERTVSRQVIVDATPAELFDLVADPRRHGELDGSGTVHDIVSGPSRLALGDTFAVRMTLRGIPYKIVSTVTGFEENALLEWQHPLKHRWRWEFAEVAPGQTLVTETWDYRDSKHSWFFQKTKYPQLNSKGIKQTLEKLHARYAKD